MTLKRILFISVFASIFLLVYCSPNQGIDLNKQIKERLSLQFDSLDASVLDLASTAESGDTTSLRSAFLKARLAFKKTEWFCEYYAPTLSRELNGPPLPEIEVEENKSAEPCGLQVIEEFIFPFDKEGKVDLEREIRSLQSSLKRSRIILKDTEFTEAHLLDACKLEVFRIISVGITGFDAPLCKNSMQEAATALESVAVLFELLGDNQKLQKLAKNAVEYASSHRDFDSFNRMQFITEYANPITQELLKWQSALNIKPLDTELALHNSAATLFDKNAFNINHFVHSNESMPSPEKILLGKSLFSDKIISGSNLTCISCHQPGLAFTDGLAKSTSFVKGKFVKRNAPTLNYAGLQNAQFYDMRSPTLESQANDVIGNKDEFHGSAEEASKRLQNDTAYYKKFKKAFGTMEKDIRPRYVMIALASYVRSLNPFNSRFDQYMRGDKSKMNQPELNGFNLFMGKAKCGTCHFMPLFNGTAAPFFANTEAEVLGVPKQPKISNAVLDPDEGRYAITKLDQLKFAFKTPTLRNIALTAPYMHNGAFSTLEEVLTFYIKGGGAGIGIHLENQTLAAEPLKLSKSEEKDILAFLNTLTDAPPRPHSSQSQ